MTGRERMLAAFRGLKVDRVPIWLREGIVLLKEPDDAGHFTCGWQADPLYHELLEAVAPHVSCFAGWWAPGFNRKMMIPSAVIDTARSGSSADARQTTASIRTPGGTLTEVTELRRGMNTSWTIKHPVESVEEMEALASVPFEIDADEVRRSVESYRQACRFAGDRALVEAFLGSPIVCISGAMPFQLFLELSVTQRERFHALLAEITRRQLALLDAVLAEAGGTLDTHVTIGGSEQCTPPMMSPQSYDEFVVPYEGQIIAWCKRHGITVQIHCHGKVRHALTCMVEEGADATDPVEPPPSGDVTYSEAREIVGDRLTLIGNIEFDMLEFGQPEDLRRCVRDILSRGSRRLILSTSACPISAVSPRLVGNYKALLDAALEFAP
jgi:uroporphyrinogen-III decarboxylase